LQVPLALDANHGLTAEAERHRVGDRDDLHDAAVDQPLDPLPDRGLGQADRLADCRVGPPAVLLELLDDPFRGVVEDDARGPPGSVPAFPPGPVPVGTLSAADDRSPWHMSHAVASFARQSCHESSRCQLISLKYMNSATESLATESFSDGVRTA